MESCIQTKMKSILIFGPHEDQSCLSGYKAAEFPTLSPPMAKRHLRNPKSSSVMSQRPKSPPLP